MKSNAPKAVWQGAALLGGAALASKLIGTLQKIPLQNLAGDRVFGLYSAVYALAVMWMTLAAAGVPVAVSLLVAERHAAGDEAGARRVRRYATALLSLTGLAAFAALQACADTLAGWMGSPEAAAAIRTSSIALLVAPMTAAMRGYAQGRMEMLRPAVSQLLEQIARVAFMLVALLWALRQAYGPASTAAAVHGGLAAGAAAGLVAMLLPIRGRRARTSASPEADVSAGGAQPRASAQDRQSELSPAPAPNETGWPLVRRIAAVALPVAAGSVVAPLFGLIDAFTLPRLLQRAGDSAAAAMTAFGEYNRGIALLQLVAMAAGGAAAALVPALTAARARGDAAGLGEQAAFAMRLAWWFGGAAAIGLALLAKPVNVALFANANGTGAMALLAIASLGAALQAVSAALLQGLGDLRSPALHLAAAALVKAALNAALAPALGIAGAALAALAAYAAAAALNARALRRLAGLPRMRAAPAARSALALAAMAAAVALGELALGALSRGLGSRAAAALTALPCVALGAVAFAAALAATGALGPREWRALPGVAGSRLERWLARLHPGERRLRRAAPGSDSR